MDCLAFLDHHGLILVEGELRGRCIFVLVFQLEHACFFTNLLRFSLLFSIINFISVV